MIKLIKSLLVLHYFAKCTVDEMQLNLRLRNLKMLNLRHNYLQTKSYYTCIILLKISYLTFFFSPATSSFLNCYSCTMSCIEASTYYSVTRLGFFALTS